LVVDKAIPKDAASLPVQAESMRETATRTEAQPDALKPEFTERLTALFQRAKDRALAAKKSPR